MKNKIEMRGIIVSSMYDCDFCKSYIEKGIITPESCFRANLAKADKSQDLNLYINSPGGSVIAGDEMINALLAWKAESGKTIHITVGALAASMAANTIVQVADPENVKVHQNSLIMFHGAMGIGGGGEESFKDYSDLLNKINANVKTTLINRYDLSPDTVDEWFAEGREGWLSSDDAKNCGMAAEIIGSQAVKPERPDNMDSLLNERGVKLAAAVLDTFNQKHMEVNTMWEKIKAKLAELAGLKADASDEEIEGAVAGFKSETDVSAAVEAGKAEVTASFATQIADAATAADAKQTELTAEITALKLQAVTDGESLTAVNAELVEANEKITTLTPGLKAVKDENSKTTSAKESFFDAVDAHKEAKGCDKETAILAITRDEPALHAAMLKEAN